MMENEGATPVETNQVETTPAPEASPESSTPLAAPAGESGVAHETSEAQPVDQTQTQPQPAQAQPGEAREQTHRPSRVDRRNAKLANENRDLRERLARLEGRFDSQQPRSEPAQAQGDSDPEPDPKNYPQGEYDPKYLRDAARWDYRQEAKIQAAARERSESESKSREEFMAKAQRFHRTIEQAEDSDFLEGGDFLKALDKAGQRDLIDDITDSDNPAALAQWLAVPKQDAKQEAYRRSVLELTGRKRVRELSRIDDYLTGYFKAQRNHTTRPAQPAAAPSSPSASTPSSAPSTPKPVPTPAPQANGRGTGGAPGAGGDGYDQLFRK